MYIIKTSEVPSTYRMECYAKTNNKWHFLGWYPVSSDHAIVSRDRGTLYLYNGTEGDERRYTVTGEVAEFLSL